MRNEVEESHIICMQYEKNAECSEDTGVVWKDCMFLLINIHDTLCMCCMSDSDKNCGKKKRGDCDEFLFLVVW